MSYNLGPSVNRALDKTGLFPDALSLRGAVSDLTTYILLVSTEFGKADIAAPVHSLASQAIITPIIRQASYGPDDINKFNIVIAASEDEQPALKIRLLADPGTRLYSPESGMFKSDFARGSVEAHVRPEVFPVEEFVSYYTDSDIHANPIYPYARMTHGDPVAATVATYLALRSGESGYTALKGDRERLLEVGHRVYALVANHWLNKRLVSLYGIRPTDVDYDDVSNNPSLYHGFVSTPSAVAAEVSANFTGIPFVAGSEKDRENNSFPFYFAVRDFISSYTNPAASNSDTILTNNILMEAFANGTMGDHDRVEELYNDFNAVPIGVRIELDAEDVITLEQIQDFPALTLDALQDDVVNLVTIIQSPGPSTDPTGDKTALKAFLGHVLSAIEKCEASSTKIINLEGSVEALRLANDRLKIQVEELRVGSVGSSIDDDLISGALSDIAADLMDVDIEEVGKGVPWVLHGHAGDLFAGMDPVGDAFMDACAHIWKKEISV